METATMNGTNMDEANEQADPSCNGSTNHLQQSISTNAQQRHISSSGRGEYITAPGEDDSKRPLLPKTSSSKPRSIEDKKRDPVILKDMTELQQHLELMHDRCIARNLRAAGLGGFEVEDEVIYGALDANAHMTTGETMLVATLLHLKEPERLHHYVSILLNDGADVNEQDSDGKTSLMHAILNGRDKAVKAILRHEKTDLLIRDNEGYTALMHAAAIGSEHMLLYFFKALRKREKHQYQKQQAKAEEQKISNAQPNSSTKPAKPDQQQQSTPAGQSPTGSRDSRELWSLLRSDDPLDLQNTRGENAHVIALKNGHVDCANLISDEKLKRAKEMNKRINALNHQRGSGSPSILRFAKKSAKKYLQHYGSFDSLYFDREDESDDELMMAANQMRRSQTADPKMGIVSSGRKTPPTTPAEIHAPVLKRHHQNKGFLVRLNKRFQSNPDLFRVKTNQSGMGQEEIGEIPTNQNAQPQGRGNEEMDAIKATSGGVKQVSTPQSHRPVIKGGSQQFNRRTSASTFTHPHKRNLAEKLMSFLRIRPKYSVPNSASDAALCSASSAARLEHKRHLNKKYSQQFPDFSSLDQAEQEIGLLRKGISQPDISPTEDKAGPRAIRRGSGPTAPKPAPLAPPESQYDPGQRRSVDLAGMHPATRKYIDDWAGSSVEEEQVSITQIPSSSSPGKSGATNLLNKQTPVAKSNFPLLPP